MPVLTEWITIISSGGIGVCLILLAYHLAMVSI